MSPPSPPLGVFLARHLASIHPTQLPGVTAWCWPRSFRHYWHRERAVGAADVSG